MEHSRTEDIDFWGFSQKLGKQSIYISTPKQTTKPVFTTGPDNAINSCSKVVHGRTLAVFPFPLKDKQILQQH
jgi:hypothetical protein